MFNRHLLPVLAIPNWLSNLTPATMEQETFPLLDLLRDSFYYPASGFDGAPVKYFAGHFLSFVYVDYGRARDEFMWDSKHRGFDGYELIGSRLVNTRELAPQGWRPMPPDPVQHVDWIQNPFCVWSVFRRREGVSDDHDGPCRFSLVYLCADGVAAFQALYVANSIAPKAMAIIQPGAGVLGGAYTRFSDPEKILFRSVLLNGGGLPENLVYGGDGDFTQYQPGCWPAYQRHVLSFSLPSDRQRHISVWKRDVDPQSSVRVKIMKRIVSEQEAVPFPEGWRESPYPRLSNLLAQFWKILGLNEYLPVLFQLKLAKDIVRHSPHVADGLEAVLDQWIEQQRRYE